MSYRYVTSFTTFIANYELSLLSAITGTVAITRGPGKRGPQCGSCWSPIKLDQASLTHIDCGNTLCFDCMIDWVESAADYPKRPTCPWCRANLDIQVSDYRRSNGSFIDRQLDIRANRQLATRFSVVRNQLEFYQQIIASICHHLGPIQPSNECFRNNKHEVHACMSREFTEVAQLERRRYLKPNLIVNILQRHTRNGLEPAIDWRRPLRSETVSWPSDEDEYLWRHYAIGYRDYHDLRVPQCPERSFCLVKCPAVVLHRDEATARSWLEETLSPTIYRAVFFERPVITWHTHHLEELLLRPLDNDGVYRVAYRQRDLPTGAWLKNEKINQKTFIQNIREFGRQPENRGRAWRLLPFTWTIPYEDWREEAAVLIYPVGPRLVRGDGPVDWLSEESNSPWLNMGQIAPPGYPLERERRYIENIRRETERWWHAEAATADAMRNGSATSSYINTHPAVAAGGNNGQAGVQDGYHYRDHVYRDDDHDHGDHNHGQLDDHQEADSYGDDEADLTNSEHSTGAEPLIGDDER